MNPTSSHCATATHVIGRTARDLLDHLMSRYGKISASDIMVNNERITAPIGIGLPINVYFQNIDNCIQYTADTNTPFMTAQILQMAYHDVLQTSKYKNALKEWHGINPVCKIWVALKTKFANEYNDQREQQKALARQGGFHITNAAVDVAVVNISSALDNLALAMTDDQDIVASLTAGNKTLTETKSCLLPSWRVPWPQSQG